MSQRIPWDLSLAWYYGSSASDMGERSNSGSILARLEGSSGGVTDSSCTWPSYDRAAVAREARVRRDLMGVPRDHRRVINVHYLAFRLPAKAEARMGRLSNVALWLAREEGKAARLIEALQSGTARVLDEYRERAERAVVAAHDAYWIIRDSR